MASTVEILPEGENSNETQYLLWPFFIKCLTCEAFHWPHKLDFFKKNVSPLPKYVTLKLGIYIRCQSKNAHKQRQRCLLSKFFRYLCKLSTRMHNAVCFLKTISALAICYRPCQHDPDWPCDMWLTSSGIHQKPTKFTCHIVIFASEKNTIEKLLNGPIFNCVDYFFELLWKIVYFALSPRVMFFQTTPLPKWNFVSGNKFSPGHRLTSSPTAQTTGGKQRNLHFCA